MYAILNRVINFDNQLTFNNLDNSFNEESGDFDWYAVKFKGQIGFMSAKYIRSQSGIA